ncbi:MAG TPA: dTMP kinase [Roseiarcus sp.]|nr:dTMP kinase [Roseiarcus sp.]
MAAPKRGCFITFEGGEGVGKSTQAQLLAERLRDAGFTIVTTREPGGSPRAEALRRVILSGAAQPFGPSGEAILFSAARIDHIDKKIEPALAAGQWVICDRFADSTRAYQGAAGKLDKGLIDSLERVAVGDTKPDLTLILDMPIERSLARAAERRDPGAAPDRFEGESRGFHEALRQAFLDIAAAEPRRCVVIDADHPSDEVAKAIWATVRERLRVRPRARGKRS